MPWWLKECFTGAATGAPAIAANGAACAVVTSWDGSLAQPASAIAAKAEAIVMGFRIWFIKCILSLLSVVTLIEYKWAASIAY
jgi:hypothetical protein